MHETTTTEQIQDKWENVDWDALNPDEFAMQILERMRAEPATFTPDQVQIIEKRAQADGITRRAMLALLAMPGKQVLETALEDRDAALGLAELQAHIRDYLDNRHDSLRELLQAADVRIMLALAQREDADQIIAEAIKKQ